MTDKIRGTPDKPLKNKKHEAFCINLLTMNRSEAYLSAGYSCKKEQARKQAERLLKTNKDVKERYEYLLNKHNEELEKKGFISRERMLENAIYAMNCTLGKLPVKLISKKSAKFKIKNEDIDTLPDDVRDKIKNIEMVDDDIIVSFEWFDEELKEVHDLKSFPTIWDKLMNALDYYPKEEKKEDEPTKIVFNIESVKKKEVEK